MQLPRKIVPDRIREAIVQVFFHSDLPFEPLIGYFHSVLSPAGFFYTNRPIRPNHFLQSGTQPLASVLDIVVPQYFFFNDLIRMQVQNDGSLTFHCMNSYPGWSTYIGQIQKVLRLLLGSGTIRDFHRAGLRYISEFPNIDILEKVNFKVELQGVNEPMVSGNFRVEWTKPPLRFIINLASKLPIAPLVVQSTEKVAFTSLIDIDVIRQDFSENNPEKLFALIDEVHLNEKEQFFQLLKPEFLKTLHPEYE